MNNATKVSVKSKSNEIDGSIKNEFRIRDQAETGRLPRLLRQAQVYRQRVILDEGKED